jgi:branched-chain amino acid transport system ATP-binding protein
MTLVVELRDVEVRREDERVLEGIDVEVGEWEIVGIVGPKGSGKTALLDTVTGIVTPQRGMVRIRGVDVTRVPAHQRASLGLARTWSEPAAVPELSVLDNLLLAQHAHVRYGWVAAVAGAPGTFLEERELARNAEEILDFLGAWDIRGVPFGGLPDRLRRRCGLAMALATDPTTLVMDEPSMGADADERRELAETLEVLRSDLNLTILVAESSPSEAVQGCDFVYAMTGGRIRSKVEPDVQSRVEPDTIESGGPERMRGDDAPNSEPPPEASAAGSPS